jgi:hypothetical protein
MIGTDFLIHAGILYPVYNQDHPFLLENTSAFYLIPVGYLSFLITAGLIYWLLRSMQYENRVKAGKFALGFGAVMWGSLILGLFSIANAPFWLLIGWFVGQTVEIGIAGYIMGWKITEYLDEGNGTSINRNIFLYVIICLVLGIVIQNIYINI